MKLFKSIDDKFRDIGFAKERDDGYGVTYVRKDPKYNYTQCLDILYKANGKHIIQSYDRDLMDDKRIGNTCIGLTYYEMKLAMKKMRQKHWRSR